MKKIEAIIRPIKLDDVRDALRELGLTELLITSTTGHGREEGYEAFYRGIKNYVDLIPNLKIEIVVKDHLLDECITAISQAARTGENGDGKIFVTEVLQAFRIRTGDTDDNAI